MSTTHHALLLFANDVLKAVIGDLATGHDIQNTEFEKLGVEEAQQLVKSAYMRPSGNTTQLCVVRAQFVTLEAQNALLKVFEEPPESTKFLLIVPRDFIVLPTLLSRCEVVLGSEVDDENLPFQEFLSAPYAERISLIEQSQKKKDTQWQRAIKKGLVEFLKTHTQNLKELEFSVRLLLTRGASNKMLLEHIALTLPASSKD